MSINPVVPMGFAPGMARSGVRCPACKTRTTDCSIQSASSDNPNASRSIMVALRIDPIGLAESVPARPILRPHIRKLRNPLHFLRGIRLRIPSAFFATITAVTTFAEIYAAGKFTDDFDVQIAKAFWLQRRHTAQRLQHLHRSDVHVQPHSLAQR